MGDHPYDGVERRNDSDHAELFERMRSIELSHARTATLQETSALQLKELAVHVESIRHVVWWATGAAAGVAALVSWVMK